MAGATHHRVAIIGSGFAGLGAAARLKQTGIDDFVVLERSDDVGGTWHVNTYPGCQCDVPSHLYSFSFAPNPGWTRTYSLQPEIWEYLQRVSREQGVDPHIRFNCEVSAAHWDKAGQLWRLQTSSGELTCELLIAGAGPLAEPKLPGHRGNRRLPGQDLSLRRMGPRALAVGRACRRARHRRLGRAVHPPHPAAGVRAAGLPAHGPVGRAPPRPVHVRASSGCSIASFRRRSAWCAGSCTSRASCSPTCSCTRVRARCPSAPATSTCARRCPSRSCAPSSPRAIASAAKRTLISNEYYPALREPNVALVTDPIVAITPHGVRTADGTERELDTLILGTGFHVSDMPWARWLHGRDGRTLEETWQGSPQGYLGANVAGFPQPIHADRTQHRPRPQLDHLHDRVPAELPARLHRPPRRRGSIET